MAAVVTFALPDDGRGSRFVVPSEAVAEDREGRYVFVVETVGDDQAVARRRPVTVGDFVENGLEILDGLQDGDHVVTAGISRLSDGDLVRAPDDAEAG